MSVPTIGRLAEECGRLIYGGNIPVAGKVSLFELKVAVGQVINSLLKIDYFQVNTRTREMIPNGAVIGLYENIATSKFHGKSQAILPIKPLKLPRNMGVWSVFDPNNPDNEYIPLQMGQSALMQSQPLLNDLMGQCGYTNYGMQVLFTKDLTSPDPTNPTMVSMRLVIMDVNQYGDYDQLPILPEMEFQVKQEVCKMYGVLIPSDKIVDPGHKEQHGTPTETQTQT